MSMEYTVPSIILGFPLILLPIDLIFITSYYYFYSYNSIGKPSVPAGFTCHTCSVRFHTYS